MTQAELIEAVRTADVLVPTVTDRIDAAAFVPGGEKLRLIASLRHRCRPYRLATARQRGITVTNTPGS